MNTTFRAFFIIRENVRKFLVVFKNDTYNSVKLHEYYIYKLCRKINQCIKMIHKQTDVTYVICVKSLKSLKKVKKSRKKSLKSLKNVKKIIFHDVMQIPHNFYDKYDAIYERLTIHKVRKSKKIQRSIPELPFLYEKVPLFAT